VAEIHGVVIDMPDVRHVVLFQVRVNTLADSNEPSLFPQEMQRSFNWFLAFSGQERVQPVAGVCAEEKPPIHAKVSRLPKPKSRIGHRPSRGREGAASRPVLTEYLDWMKGIRSPSKSLSNLAKRSCGHRVCAGPSLG